jgi:MFS family permease
MFARALLHRGWWLVTSVYLVVESGLSPAQLVSIGVAQGVVSLLFEVPAGVVADTIGRRTSLLVSHALMGTAMLVTGLVTDFWLIVVTQMVWGISWTFASGADVAWITDELDDPARISSVLVRAGRFELFGSAAGLVVVGGLGSFVGRGTAMVVAGGAMVALGAYVAVRFRELRFSPASERRWAASWEILRNGFRLVRGSRAILVMFAATFLVNGAADVARMFQLRLVELGFPPDPVVWFTLLGVLTLVVGAVVLRLVEGRIDSVRGALLWYGLACLAGVLGLVTLAVAPEHLSGSAAVIMIVGIAAPMTRLIGMIWVNRETSGDVRATVHSFLAQAEYLGEIVCGFGIVAIAAFAGLPAAFLTAAALFAVTILVVARAHTKP